MAGSNPRPGRAARARLAAASALACVCAALAGCNPTTPARADAGDGGRPDAGKADGGSRAAATTADAGAADDLMPAASSEELTGRARHLIEAITQDNPDLASDIMFPREGYVAVRDVGDPTKAWEKQVQNPFRKALHRLRKKKGMERAQFVSFELGHAVVQSGMRRGGWKKPLWVVKHSKVVYTVDGRSYRLDVSEMTGWRGAWYVTRLR